MVNLAVLKVGSSVTRNAVLKLDHWSDVISSSYVSEQVHPKAQTKIKELPILRQLDPVGGSGRRQGQRHRQRGRKTFAGITVGIVQHRSAVRGLII